MSNIHLKIEAQINPTEESEKVKQALENIFGPVSFKIKPKTWGQLLIGEISGIVGLTNLANTIKREQIISAARKILRNLATETKITFYLNKQVAYAGHISFSEQSGESPLGPIKIEIECDNSQKLIDWLTPRRPK
ncbi:hypothetical protein E2P30_02125 [Candidatus Bathyarchaeota archaeon]|nr:hypothetical protein E2P30_02125 [Candidatus Bathyarchaeota archaeon]